MRVMYALLVGGLAISIVGGCTHKMKTGHLHEESEPYVQQGRIEYDSWSTSHLLRIVRGLLPKS